MNTKVHAKLAQVPGARAIVKGFRNLRERIFMPLRQTTNEHEAMLKILADTNFQMRAIMKHAQNKPINVLFVCHEPALWNMFESIYEVMENDSAFCPMVVALPYRHPTLPNGQYKDAGMYEYCQSQNIKAIQGLNKETNDWLNPASLLPDYVFFQTPYPLLIPAWSVEQIAMMARICYVPYGSSVAKGKIATNVHPEGFFRYVSLFFTENQMKRELLEKRFEEKNWFEKENIIVSGYPKFDYLNEIKNYSGKAWKRGTRKDIKRILWTPRYLTTEGTCHFFDYKNYFVEFCKNQPDVDFVFRPHPLCFQNFIKTGEMNLDEQNKMKYEYHISPNMAIDETESYEDTFMTSDILISDYSSLIIEYFATGKPIIYTHRKNEFNEYALALSAGMYWVQSIKELDETILMLLSGMDPLSKKRKELINRYFFMPEGGAGLAIKEYLHADYRKCLSTNE